MIGIPRIYTAMFTDDKVSDIYCLAVIFCELFNNQSSLF